MPRKGDSRLNEQPAQATQGWKPLDTQQNTQRTFTPLSTQRNGGDNQLSNKDAGRGKTKRGRDAEARFVASAQRVLLELGYENEIEQSGELDAKKVDTRVRWRRGPEEPWEATDVQVSVGEKSRNQQKLLERSGITPVAMPAEEPDTATDERLLFLFLPTN